MQASTARPCQSHPAHGACKHSTPLPMPPCARCVQAQHAPTNATLRKVLESTAPSQQTSVPDALGSSQQASAVWQQTPCTFRHCTHPKSSQEAAIGHPITQRLLPPLGACMHAGACMCVCLRVCAHKRLSPPCCTCAWSMCCCTLAHPCPPRNDSPPPTVSADPEIMSSGQQFSAAWLRPAMPFTAPGPDTVSSTAGTPERKPAGGWSKLLYVACAHHAL